ncbi:GTP-binding protein [bacterium]|nr:GTP-binding protein [bacterium]
MQPCSAGKSDTIAAISSAVGPACRGIVRVSGNEVAGILGRVFTQPIRTLCRASRIDAAIELQPGIELPLSVSLWPDARSFTGEPMAELHLPGSPPLIDAVLRRVFDAGARPARRGEFTLRAFLAGKLDLAQAEAVLGVIDAADSTELSTALRQLAGGLSSRISAVRDDLLNLLADLEAGLDFVEEDIEFVSSDETVSRLTSAAEAIAEIERGATARMQSRTQTRVVLAGLPNAGKSTLFNALLNRDAAIVSEQSGTTRDYLTATVRWGRLDVELIDTAGWELERSGIESVAQHFRDEQICEADVIVWCSSAVLSHEEVDQDRQLRELLPTLTRAVCVQTQSDRLTEIAADAVSERPESLDDAAVAGTTTCSDSILAISAFTGDGLATLRKLLIDRLVADASETSELLGSTAARSRTALKRAVSSLDTARTEAQFGSGDELVAVEIREAIASLGEVVGAVYTDDLLDRIFSRFCIGK